MIVMVSGEFECGRKLSWVILRYYFDVLLD
jgi:hypothetical protein